MHGRLATCSCGSCKLTLPLAQAMAQRNAAKVHAKWRDLLRQAKLVELQKEVKRISEAHEAAVLAKSKLTEVWLWSPASGMLCCS